MKTLRGYAWAWGIPIAVFCAAWFGLDALGYRAGSRVGAGSVAINPELLKSGLAVLVTLVSGWLSHLPVTDAIRQILAKLGIASPLTTEQILDQHKRIEMNLKLPEEPKT